MLIEEICEHARVAVIGTLQVQADDVMMVIVASTPTYGFKAVDQLGGYTNPRAAPAQ